MDNLSNIRVYHDGPHHMVHSIEHMLAVHFGTGQTKDHPVADVLPNTLESLRDELQRLHVIEKEHGAMSSQLKALKIGGTQ